MTGAKHPYSWLWAVCVLTVAGCARRPGVEVVVPEPSAQVATAVASSPGRGTYYVGAGDALTTVSPDEYIAHIAYLAHDKLKGRDTGSTGIDLAAGYIAGQFAAAGLEPGGQDGTYFQEFDIPTRVHLGDDTSLLVEGAPVEPVLREDFLPFSSSPEGTFEGDVVFVGYGITNPDKDHDDYSDIDVEGKVVVMLRREPSDWEPGGYTDHATFRAKVALAAEHNAAGVLIVNQKPGLFGEDDLRAFRAGGRKYKVHTLHVKRKLGDALLEAGGLANLIELQETLDAGDGPVSAPCDGVHLSGEVAYEAEVMVARNVIGVLPATGRLGDEYLVIGGHYDHLGQQGGSIHNGADDNASGTAGVIEAAKMLATQAHRDRSVIFMAFTAEEKGLIGSRHFVDNPTVPLKAIKAMLNMDMIGRHDPDSDQNQLTIQGIGTGDTFEAMVQEHAEALGIEYAPMAGAIGGSDHTSFSRAGVPAMFFFTGIHPDYHRPGDDTEKIEAVRAARITDLVCRLAMNLINDERMPEFVKVEQPSRFSMFGGPRAGGVVMGIMPVQDDDPEEAGWEVASVLDGGGAAKAGMQDGDVIFEIDGQAINGLADYRKIVRDKKGGDVLEVKVRRGDEELTLDVELRARGG